jgi:serine/threonine-protein kinase
MFEGKELGPFKIEKELGSGAMGTVYRGIYTETGLRVAIKLMAPGLAANESASKRFEKEAQILKQMKHPNIVRMFGVGKFQGTRYYAMEYVEGQSLDRVLARRGKLSWEDVLKYGRQLCDALQHAHERGVVHRDLKPSNLMILPDGTLKLTDFGIAKDLDATALTSANCTVGTAAYMSPEQCRGERNLTHKSDLYSLGVVFYELATGRKPFLCDTAMEMFLAHVEGEFERPSRLVLDLPVWFDTLICQLMEKQPDKRPFDAAAVGEALDRIQEKVEAQQSAGEDAARKRVMDRLSGEKRPDEEDKDAARALTGKSKKKRKKTPWFSTVWVQVAGLVAILAGLGLALWLIFRPPSAESLYKQAEKLMASKEPDDWYKARSGPIKEYLAHYTSRPGEQTKQVREWASQIDRYENHQLVQNYIRKKRKQITISSQNDAQELAFKAADAEERGDLETAKKTWEEVQKKFGPGSGYTSWGSLAEDRVAMIASVEKLKEGKGDWEDIFKKLDLYGTEPEGLQGEEQVAFRALRYQRFGDPVRARNLWKDLRDKTDEAAEKDMAKRRWYLLAADGVRKLEDAAREVDRKALLEKKLAELKKAFKWEDARAILTLYSQDPDLQPLVEQTRALVREREGQ